MKRSIVITIALAASQFVVFQAHGQGLLGQILRASHGPQSTPGQYPGVPMAGSGTARTEYLTELQIRGSHWVVISQTSSGDAYPSPMACQANLARDAKLALSDYAVRPAVQRFLQPNVVVVKDAAEQDNPMWKIAVLACGKGSPVTDQPLDEMSGQAMAGSEVNISAVLDQATDLVRQTDGSFPPPATQAMVAQAARNQAYLFTWVQWDAGGHLAGIRPYDTLFDTAADCDRFAEAQMRDLRLKNMTARIIGNSVLIPLDASEYDWLGCLHPGAMKSPEGSAYFETKMTPDRARSMQRFPNFGSPADNPPSQRGKKVKI